ncbi:hypothetical protein AC791_05385 [Klebsiella sp. RIT-PI-d]|uniref:hypothetical protein n=1 Tax=Klebsiella sp. RIT-PI-d TaxID=1681196 RepID=UPI000676B100|nr:hypothetical protein [Klebsiella sp. RIT-PI-d]KNC11366.1 hypothetical protein AC791_05385 [Klebsiella sp. RIT-PI-d]
MLCTSANRSFNNIHFATVSHTRNVSRIQSSNSEQANAGSRFSSFAATLKKVVNVPFDFFKSQPQLIAGIGIAMTAIGGLTDKSTAMGIGMALTAAGTLGYMSNIHAENKAMNEATNKSTNEAGYKEIYQENDKADYEVINEATNEVVDEAKYEAIKEEINQAIDKAIKDSIKEVVIGALNEVVNEVANEARDKEKKKLMGTFFDEANSPA